MTETRMQPYLAIVLIIAQILVSAASMVVEVVAGRVLAPYVGMSLYTWTSIIAVVLAGFSLGHWVGGRIAAKGTVRSLVETSIWMIAAAFSTALIIWILRQTADFALTSFDEQVGAILTLSLAAFFIPSLCAGVPAPVLTQMIMVIDPNRSAHRLGIMYAAGAIGAIVGTLSSGFLFIAWLGSSSTLAVIVAVYVILSLVFWIMAHGWKTRSTAFVALIGFVNLAIAGTLQAMPSVCTKESDYFCIRVVDLADSPDHPVRGMVLDHLIHGIGARDDPLTMYTDHAAALDKLATKLVPKKDFSAFFIGGGTYSIPRKWQITLPNSKITIAEIDPSVTQAAKDFFWYDPQRDNVVHQDARRDLNSTTDVYDIVIGDAFTDIAVPEHLITKEFFETVRGRLTPDGYYLMNVIDYSDKMMVIGSIARTLLSVFPSVEIWTEARRPDFGERMVFIVVAGHAPSTFSDVTFKSPDVMHFAAFDRSFVTQLAGLDGAVTFTDDYIPINRMLGGRFE